LRGKIANTRDWTRVKDQGSPVAEPVTDTSFVGTPKKGSAVTDETPLMAKPIFGFSVSYAY